MASRRSFGLVVLFLWLQSAASESEVIGMLGSSVELRCPYDGEKSLDKHRVQWQATEPVPCLVDAYFPNKHDKKNCCKEFRNRTQFIKEDFSLKLFHVTVKDERTYECVVQRNTSIEFNFAHKATVTLKVAAYYSKPSITRIGQTGDEMTFNCNSSHGYPEQKLHWTNQMDNSLFNVTEWPATLEPNGTFSVSSTLRIKSASNIKLECTIENERLGQNTTAVFEETNSSVSSENNKSANSVSRHNRPAVMSILVVILILPVIMYICWGEKSCPGRTYTAGVCVEKAEHANAPVETEHSLISGTVGEHQ
ncbi:hypothetical protein JRQ81_020135 [Phrynocephalus forsythii]|uniref:Ig-like domain-containing protein n=1 Tax=Phrynocephalus forsythii TaxID=171643 RepID=A0A9Q0XNS6_9SAUR|nr:hypothetical protein JRQ81_020135 [Phrynocephalus forsythii]